MCGRYTLQAEADELIRRFGIRQLSIPIDQRYNIAPSQTVPVVTSNVRKESGETEYTVDGFRWGFQAKLGDSANKLMINARMETLLEKPMFKNLFLSNRCVIPANGFYEWSTKRPGNERSRPYAINVNDGELIGFAGLWRPIRDAQGEVQKLCIIITVPANDKLGALHSRMPAILMPSDERLWLDPECVDKELLLSLLHPYPDARIKYYPVSTLVNSTKIDASECLMPAQEDLATTPIETQANRSSKQKERSKEGPTQLSIFDVAREKTAGEP
jgi:putative SOS response-associated peptidase YedK